MDGSEPVRAVGPRPAGPHHAHPGRLSTTPGRSQMAAGYLTASPAGKSKSGPPDPFPVTRSTPSRSRQWPKRASTSPPRPRNPDHRISSSLRRGHHHGLRRCSPTTSSEGSTGSSSSAATPTSHPSAARRSVRAADGQPPVQPGSPGHCGDRQGVAGHAARGRDPWSPTRSGLITCCGCSAARAIRPRWGGRSPSTAGSTRPSTCWPWSTRSTTPTCGADEPAADRAGVPPRPGPQDLPRRPGPDPRGLPRRPGRPAGGARPGPRRRRAVEHPLPGRHRHRAAVLRDPGRRRRRRPALAAGQGASQRVGPLLLHRLPVAHGLAPAARPGGRRTPRPSTRTDR